MLLLEASRIFVCNVFFAFIESSDFVYRLGMFLLGFLWCEFGISSFDLIFSVLFFESIVGYWISIWDSEL